MMTTMIPLPNQRPNPTSQGLSQSLGMVGMPHETGH
jgi:hypothetical protein